MKSKMLRKGLAVGVLAITSGYALQASAALSSASLNMAVSRIKWLWPLTPTKLSEPLMLFLP